MFDRLLRPPLLALLLIASMLACAAPATADDDPVPGPAAALVTPSPAAPAIGTSPSLPDPSKPGELIAGLQSAAKGGKWLLVIALVVNALVWLLRWGTPKILPKLGDWFGSDKGGTLLALTIGVLSVAVVQLQSGRFDPWMLASGLAAGLLSIGNYTAPKKAASPA